MRLDKVAQLQIAVKLVERMAKKRDVMLWKETRFSEIVYFCKVVFIGIKTYTTLVGFVFPKGGWNRFHSHHDNILLGCVCILHQFHFHDFCTFCLLFTSQCDWQWWRYHRTHFDTILVGLSWRTAMTWKSSTVGPDVFIDGFTNSSQCDATIDFRYIDDRRGPNIIFFYGSLLSFCNQLSEITFFYLPPKEVPFDVDFELCWNGAIDEKVRRRADE